MNGLNAKLKNEEIEGEFLEEISDDEASGNYNSADIDFDSMILVRRRKQKKY